MYSQTANNFIISCSEINAQIGIAAMARVRLVSNMFQSGLGENPTCHRAKIRCLTSDPKLRIFKLDENVNHKDGD